MDMVTINVSSAEELVESACVAIDAWRTEFRAALEAAQTPEEWAAVAGEFFPIGRGISEEIHLAVFDLADERVGLWYHHLLNRNVGANSGEALTMAVAAGRLELAGRIRDELLEDLVLALPRL